MKTGSFGSRKPVYETNSLVCLANQNLTRICVRGSRAALQFLKFNLIRFPFLDLLLHKIQLHKVHQSVCEKLLQDPQ